MQQNSEDRTIAYNLISFIFVFLLIIFTTTILVTRFLYARVIQQSQLYNMTHLAHERVYLLDGRLLKLQSLANTSMNLISEFDLSETEISRILRSMVVDNPEIQSICLVNSITEPNPPILHYTVRHRYLNRFITGDEYKYQDWYQIPLYSGKSGWTEPWYDADGKGKLIISYSMPIFKKGEVTGILRFDTELRYLQDMIAGGVFFKVGNSFLISTTGAFIAHKDENLVNNQTLFSLAQEYQDDDLFKLGKAMTSGESGHIFIHGNSPLKDSWVYYYPLQSNKWSVAISVPNADLMASVNVVLMIQTISSIFLFLIIAILVYARTMNVAKPLRALTIAADKIGAGDFDAKLPVSDKSYEIARLGQSFSAMQLSLKEYIASLKQTTEEKNRIRGDVIYASEIQTNLIPKNTEHPFGIKELRAYGILEPAGDIGGDLYDYFMMDEDHFCFVIADVVGKGIVAAMAMTMVSTLLPSIAPYHKSSSSLLNSLNKFLCQNNPETNFTTVFLGIIELSSGTLEFSNCGHVPFFIRKMDGSYHRYSETHSTALGVFDKLSIGSDVLPLSIGDEIILFTDGITEAMNDKEEFLGITGMEGIIAKIPKNNPETTAKAILASVHKYASKSENRDDITLLVLDYKHPMLK